MQFMGWSSALSLTDKFWYMLGYTGLMLLAGVVLYFWKVRPARRRRERRIALHTQEMMRTHREALPTHPMICERCKLRLKVPGCSMCAWCGI